MKKMKKTLLVSGMVVALVGFMAIVSAHATPDLDYSLPGGSGSLSYVSGPGALVGTGITVSGVKGEDVTANSSITLVINGGTLSFTSGSYMGLNSHGYMTWGAGPSGGFTIVGTIDPIGTFVGTTGNASGCLAYGQVLSSSLQEQYGVEKVNVAVAIDTQDSVIASYYNLPTGVPYIASFGFYVQGPDLTTGAWSSTLVQSGDLINTPVPEPASLFLYGALLLGLGLLRRYHWKAKA